MTCECDFPSHLGHGCIREAIDLCMECGVAICDQCNSASYSEDLKGNHILCHRCYRQIVGTNYNPKETTHGPASSP